MITAWAKEMKMPSLAVLLSVAGALASAALIAKGIADMRYLYIGILFVPALLYIGLRDPFIFPLGAYVFLVPFDSILMLTGGSSGPTLTKYLGIATIVVLLVKGSAEHRLHQPRAAALWLGLFVFWGILSGWWAIDPGQTFYRLPTAAGLLLVYWVVAAYRVDQRDFDLLSGFCLAGGIAAALFMLYYYSTQGVVERATIVMGEQQADNNEAAFTLLLPASIALQKIRTLRSAGRILMTAAFVLIVAGLVVTGSRGALLGFLCILFIHLAFIRRKALSFGLTLAGVMLLLSVTPDFFLERWRDSLDSGGAGRTSIWYVGWKALERYWLLGSGLHNFPFAYTEFADYAPAFKGLYRGAHNIYIETFVELGVVGIGMMAGWIWKHFSILRCASSGRAPSAVALAAAFAGCLVSSAFVGILWVKAFWLAPLLIAVHGNLPGERDCR